MDEEVVYTVVWLAGSLVGYFLARVVWKKMVVPEIRDDDNIFLTILSLMLSWCVVIGSVAYLAIHYLYTALKDVDDEAYWFGRKGEGLTDRHKDEK